MKSPTHSVLLTLALASGCQMGGNATSDDFELYDGPVYGGIQGVVLDTAGEGLVDIPVTLSNGEQVLTGTDGAYHFARVEPGTYVVRVSVIEYAEQLRKVVIDDWRTHDANFALYPTGAIFDVDNTEGGIFQEGRLLVDAPPFAFAGDGHLQLALTVPDILETGTAGAPGTFLMPDGEQMLASFGFWDIRVFSDGELSNVADGETVTLAYELLDDDEIPAAQRHLMGETMNLWTFDQEQATWVWMDELDVQGRGDEARSVTAELPHFSPWNCDELFASTCVEVWVEDQVGNPIEGVEVSLTGSDYVAVTTANTDENGMGIVQGMPNGTGSIKASLMVGDRPYNEVIEGVNLAGAASPGTVCPVKETIVLPVCMVGGDIQVSVFNKASVDDRGQVQNARVPAGAAVFYRPGEDFGACADPLGEDMEPGDWMTVDPEDDITGQYKPEDNENMGAGDVVRVKDAEVTLDLTVEKVEDGDLIYISAETDEDVLETNGGLMADGGSLDIRVQGEEDGLPGFEATGAIDVADTPELSVVREGGTSITFNKGDEVILALENSRLSEDPTYVIVTTEDGGALIGKFAADTDPTLPRWVTEEMADGSAITVFKQKVGFLELPNGYYARTTTMNATSVTAEENSGR
ncbi:MAG: carboxypeptidase-like regulatory domain-containing protein [Pseudomonadota bacterium]